MVDHLQRGGAIEDVPLNRRFSERTRDYSSQAPDGTSYWSANYKITRFNDYCAFVKHLPKRKCVKHYHGVYQAS